MAPARGMRARAPGRRGRGSEEDRSQLFLNTSPPGQQLRGSPRAPRSSPASFPTHCRGLPAPGGRLPRESLGHPRPAVARTLRLLAVIPAPASVSRSGYSRAGSSPARASPGITTLFYTNSRGAPCAAPVDWFLSGGGCSHPLSSSCNRARARRAPAAQGGRQSCSGPRGAGQAALPRPAWCSAPVGPQPQGERGTRLRPETSRLGSRSSCFCQLAQDKKVGACPRLESLRLALLWGLT